MAEVNKINSFKSFTEIKAQGSALKLREENQTKRQELASNFTSILDEMGITSLAELDEETQKTFISKVLGKEVNEGNAFVYAASKAKAAGETEFEFNGKTYKVTIKDTGVKESEVVEEGNAFGDAVKKAKEAGEKEFEFEGETFKVEESAVTEAKFVKEFNKEVLDAKTEAEILAIYPKAQFFKGKHSHFFGELDENLFFKAYYTNGSEFKINSVYSEKNKDYVHLYNESVVTEEENPCWDDYKVGDPKTKISSRSGKRVNNCVPKNESFVTEASMSDIDQMAQDSKDFKSFVKEFTKTHRDLSTAGEPGQFMDWLQSIYDGAKENMEESVVTEGKADYMAKYKDTNINLKKAYNHLNDEELNQLYLEIGELVSGNKLKVKDVTLVFESELTEGAKEDALYRKQQLATLKNAKKDKSKKMTIELDWMLDEEPLSGKQFVSDMKKFSISVGEPTKSNDEYSGSEYVVKFTGSRDSLKKLIDKYYGGDSETYLDEAKKVLVNEAEIKSDDEFKEYAFTVLKNAFESDFDEAKAEEIVSGILAKVDGDYGAAVGMLTSSLA